jgi:hypothetical protein
MAAGGRLELRRRRVVRDGAAASEAADVVAVEEPLAIRVDG